MAMHRISAPRSRQRGLSFISLVFLLVIFVSIGYLGTKSMPCSWVAGDRKGHEKGRE